MHLIHVINNVVVIHNAHLLQYLDGIHMVYVQMIVYLYHHVVLYLLNHLQEIYIVVSEHYTQYLFEIQISNIISYLYVQVIQRLFCIQRINFININTQYTTTSTTEQISILTTTQQTISAQDPRITALSNVSSAINIPLKNSLGLCNIASPSNTQVSLKIMQNIPYQSCKVMISSQASIQNSQILSLANILNSLSNTNIKVRNNVNVGSINATNQTTTATTCSGTTCNNVVRFIKLIFTVSSDGSTATLSDTSYVVVGDLSFSNTPFYTDIGYSYQFIQSINITTSTNSISYQFGTPLQLLYLDTSSNSYYRILNPITVPFRKQPILLEFGKDAIYSCLSSDTNCSMFTSISLIFNYIGRISSPQTIGDYIQVNYPTDNPSKMQIIIYYVKVGSQTNPQYSIINVQVNSITPNSNNGLETVYFEYQEVQNNALLYIPSPPTVQAYLPDDFLYPFFIA